MYRGKQSVKINDVWSDWEEIDKGTPNAFPVSWIKEGSIYNYGDDDYVISVKHE